MAKYDVLFYLPTLDTILPHSGDSLRHTDLTKYLQYSIWL